MALTKYRNLATRNYRRLLHVSRVRRRKSKRKNIISNSMFILTVGAERRSDGVVLWTARVTLVSVVTLRALFYTRDPFDGNPPGRRTIELCRRIFENRAPGEFPSGIHAGNPYFNYTALTCSTSNSVTKTNNIRRDTILSPQTSSGLRYLKSIVKILPPSYAYAVKSIRNVRKPRGKFIEGVIRLVRRDSVLCASPLELIPYSISKLQKPFCPERLRCFVGNNSIRYSYGDRT